MAVVFGVDGSVGIGTGPASGVAGGASLGESAGVGVVAAGVGSAWVSGMVRVAAPLTVPQQAVE